MVRLISASAEKVSAKARETNGFTSIYESLAVMRFDASESLVENMRSELGKGTDVSAIYVLTCGQDAELDAFLTESVRGGCDVKYLLLNVDGASTSLSNPVRQTVSNQVRVSYGDDIAAVLEGLM